MVHDPAGEAFVEQVISERGQRISFLLNPGRWRTYALAHPLAWQSVRFEDQSRASVPKERGIYAFVVKHDNGYFPPHGFIMYIGITGIRGSQRTLRERYGDYIRERQRNKRPAVYFFLNAYKDDLFFYYASMTSTAANLEELEKALNDAIVPPFNKKDFSARMLRIIRAFG